MGKGTVGGGDRKRTGGGREGDKEREVEWRKEELEMGRGREGVRGWAGRRVGGRGGGACEREDKEQEEEGREMRKVKWSEAKKGLGDEGGREEGR